jgi:hypothetical protein
MDESGRSAVFPDAPLESGAACHASTPGALHHGIYRARPVMLQHPGWISLNPDILTSPSLM